MKMLKNLLVLFVVALAGSNCFAQGPNPTLLTIEGNETSLAEFEAIYKKNNTNPQIDEKSLEEYLELYINFKLKVKEAEEKGMDTVSAFKKELAGYRKQLAQPYLTDRNMNEALLKEAYERMKMDVSASHILLKVDPDAAPADTLRAYKKLMAVRGKVERGSDFGKLAQEVSEDPSAKDNKGFLGYFGAFRMVYPFESAAYETEKGKISKPIRSQFGYHLVYVHDKRKARGQIRAAHIMVKSNDKMTEEERTAAKKKVDELYAKLKGGEPFEKLASDFSDDKGSAKKGGELPWFSTGKMVQSFEDAAFALPNDGDYSEPILSQFGWHIVKRLERKGLEPFEEVEAEIKRKIERDGRGAKSRTSLLNKIKKEYGYNPDMAAVKEFEKMIFPGTDQKFTVDQAAGMNKIIFTLTDVTYGKNTHSYTQSDFAKYLTLKLPTQPKDATAESAVRTIFADYAETALILFEDINLENKYPEFKALVNEYRDGILLFELMDNKVWSKAVKDTAGLEAYHEKNKQKFMWPERLQAVVYTCENEEIAAQTRKIAKKRAKKGYSDKDVMSMVNTESELSLKVESGNFLKGDNSVIDGIKWEAGTTENMKIGDKVVFVSVEKWLQPEPKSLSEARGLVTADYQTYLEEEWIKELRGKYKMQVNRSVLSQVK